MKKKKNQIAFFMVLLLTILRVAHFLHAMADAARWYRYDDCMAWWWEIAFICQSRTSNDWAIEILGKSMPLIN